MKSIKNKIINILCGIFIFSSISSCDEVEEPNIGGTTTKDFSGDWFISLKDTNGADIGGGDFFLHHTYNTAANDNTLWIDDEKHGYYIKCKVTMNLADGTFTATNADNANDPGTKVTVTNGKIEKGTGMSKAGHKVDKITFTAHFSYDPAGYNIIHTGHKRTGFIEDEY